MHPRSWLAGYSGRVWKLQVQGKLISKNKMKKQLEKTSRPAQASAPAHICTHHTKFKFILSYVVTILALSRGDVSQNQRKSGWKDGSAVKKSTGSSSRFESQRPHGSSQTTLFNSSFRESGSLFWLPQVLHTCDAQSYVQLESIHIQFKQTNKQKH